MRQLIGYIKANETLTTYANVCMNECCSELDELIKIDNVKEDKDDLHLDCIMSHNLIHQLKQLADIIKDLQTLNSHLRI